MNDLQHTKKCLELPAGKTESERIYEIVDSYVRSNRAKQVPEGKASLSTTLPAKHPGDKDGVRAAIQLQTMLVQVIEERLLKNAIQIVSQKPFTGHQDRHSVDSIRAMTAYQQENANVHVAFLF